MLLLYFVESALSIKDMSSQNSNANLDIQIWMKQQRLNHMFEKRNIKFLI